MIKILILLFVFITSFVFGDELEYEETRFEKFWKRTFQRMTYREPITYMPLNIKIGYYYFGNSDYWKQWGNVLKNPDAISSSPFVLKESATFPYFGEHTYRTGFLFELDILKINFFDQYQNAVDIQIGLGYKYSSAMKSLDFREIDIKPRFHNINFNTTFIFQWKPKYFSYVYYSFGPTKAFFYNTPKGEANGEGFDHAVGIGFNFITPSKKKNNNVNYGIEVNFGKCNINDIHEPPNYENIKSFNMSKVGLIFSFGIGYGGKASLGDAAYLNILKEDYLLALEQLNTFQYQNKYPHKDSQIEDMMQLCRDEISLQLYNQAMEKYYNGDWEKSLELLNQASFKANDNLKFDIENKKYFIADEVLSNSDKLLKNYSIDEQILFFEDFKSTSVKIYSSVNQKIADLFMKKGDLYFERKDYNKAYEMYVISIDKDEGQLNIINLKIENMTINILNDAYKFLQNNQHVITYELLSLLSDISKEKRITKSLMAIVEQTLQDKKIANIRNRVQKIFKNQREFVIDFEYKDIYIGDKYEDIVKILGSPEYKVNKKKLNDEYEMLIFTIENLNYKLFFRNKILIDVERN